jgi:phosphoglycolate phosphatase
MTSGAGPNCALRLLKAAIFDLDGTLLDTIEDIAGAMNRVLAARALGTYDVEKYKLLVGDGIEEMVRRALAPRRLAPAGIDDVVREYRREYEASWRAHSRPYPGIPELLGELRRRGVKTAVLSNKSHPFTVAMTAELLAGFRFDVVRGALAGVPLKPDPAPALSLAAEMGVAAPEILFLGDTKVDMMTAVSAGMFPAGALWGFRSETELRSGGAAVLVASPLDLLACFPAA